MPEEGLGWVAGGGDQGTDLRGAREGEHGGDGSTEPEAGRLWQVGGRQVSQEEGGMQRVSKGQRWEAQKEGKESKQR